MSTAPLSAELETTTGETAARPVVNAEDIAALRRDFYVRLDQSDAELLQTLAGHDDVVLLARQWDWNDTEVRDRAGAIFDEAFDLDLP